MIFLRNPEVIIYQQSHGDAADQSQEPQGEGGRLKAIHPGKLNRKSGYQSAGRASKGNEAMDALLPIIHPELVL